MPTKKQTKAEEAVPEGNDIKPANKTVNEYLAKQTLTLEAYAPFQYKPHPLADPVTVQKGDLFLPPSDWTRDFVHDGTMKVAKKHRDDLGITFAYKGEVINPNDKPENRERREHRVTLPLKEA